MPGKTTIAAALAHELEVEFLEGDAFHSPANVRKMAAGIPLTEGLAFALVRVTDCNESPVAGGKLTTSVGSPPVYFRLGAPDVQATETDASGIALFVNLPTPDMVTISGTIGDVVLRDNVVETRTNEFVQTLARP